MLKPEAIVSDMKQSLLELINNIKEEGPIPDIMRNTVMTDIPKSGAGSQFKLENQRGIFKLSIFRSLLFRIIYNRKYEIIDANMTDSNIGARRKKAEETIYTMG